MGASVRPVPDPAGVDVQFYLILSAVGNHLQDFLAKRRRYEANLKDGLL